MYWYVLRQAGKKRFIVVELGPRVGREIENGSDFIILRGPYEFKHEAEAAAFADAAGPYEYANSNCIPTTE